MGGFRLQDGNTVFSKGPVITAMEEGAVLCLDEYDLGSPTRIMCLQSVMEGKGYLIKKTGEYVTPKPGFTVIATANTKGIGDDTGLYVGTQILNEAALDRFPIVIDVDYPSIDEERVRITKVCDKIDLSFAKIEQEVDTLLKFVNEVRESKKNADDLVYNISSRRISQIIRSYKIFGGHIVTGKQ